MNTSEPALSPEQGLHLISETIAKTKDNLKDQSFCYLLWGWLIAIASLLFFGLEQYTQFKYFFLPFPVLSGIGIFLTVSYFKKRIRSTETYLNFFLNRMWMVLGLSFIFVVVINVSHHHTPFTYTLLIDGIGTFVSGWVMRFRPLFFGGVTFFASAMLSTFIPVEYTALLHGIAIITGYLIPGYMLKYYKGPTVDV